MTSRNPLHGLPAEVKARLRERAQPRWVAPMLATLTDERFSREGWLFEPKWDGERCLAFRSGGELNLFTRNRIRLNEKYPELTAAFHRQRTDSFIADGEIVTFKDGITSFTKLQERMQVEHPSDELHRRDQVSLYLFDLLY
jgi:bifunctional non-homologous end joining protein LigD